MGDQSLFAGSNFIVSILLGRWLIPTHYGAFSTAYSVFLSTFELRLANPQADLELGFAPEKLCPPKGECAEITMAQVWRRAGVTPEQLIANGEALRKKEDFVSARAWYKRAEVLGPDLRSTLYYLDYQQALKEGHESEAYAALERAIQADAGWVDGDMRFVAWYSYGAHLYLEQNLEKAEQILIRSLDLYPGRGEGYLSEAYRLLGLSTASQGHVREALQYLKQAVYINPNNVWVLIHYGKWLYNDDHRNVNRTQIIFLR